MKRIFLAVMMVFITLGLTGCGDGGGSAQIVVTPPQTFVTTISSNPAFDGDIKQDFVTGLLTVQPSPLAVLVGLDPLTEDEYRGFLHFPLTGIGGVPGDAVIVSAFLDIVINSIVLQPPTNTIPIRIDLVSLQPATLSGPEFFRDSPLALASITFPIFRADVGNSVSVDVTSLMVEAQRLGLVNFQIRMLEDLGIVSPGLIGIDDTTVALAPRLIVTYF
ncbi:MAG: hypothetical protein H7Y05_02895 [Steroidobacteraceae bacterium]|nr:hypothetical protein [Deltaproteobacteria bacterium]